MLDKLKAFKRDKTLNSMLGVNSYGQQLSEFDIVRNRHRDFIGSMWQEIGQLQFDFMLEQGLQPQDQLLDIGCGCLRGGVRFLEYLETGNYYGLDINASLIKAAWHELKLAKLEEKKPNLQVSEKFEIEKFQQQFDYMLAISLFSHLPINIIIRCLAAVRANLTPQGNYYATFFLAPSSAYLDEITHDPGEITTHYDRDPFHYSWSEIEFMARSANLEAILIGDWNHPRNQQMVKFSRLPN